MCVIAVCEKRRLTDREGRLMDAANPHGIGIAWADVKAGRVEYVKGLDVAGALAILPNLPLPQVVHFRFASVGGVTPGLTHPFPIMPTPHDRLEGKARRVMFHNGTWGAWRTGFEAMKEIGSLPVDAAEAGWSDSRVMAALMAAYAPHAVAEIVGPGQRLAVLDAKGRVQTFGAFHRHHGLLVSNLWWWEDRAMREPKPAVLRAPGKPKGKPAQIAFAESACDAFGGYGPTWTPPRFADLPSVYRPAEKPKVPRPTWPQRGGR